MCLFILSDVSTAKRELSLYGATSQIIFSSDQPEPGIIEFATGDPSNLSFNKDVRLKSLRLPKLVEKFQGDGYKCVPGTWSPSGFKDINGECRECPFGYYNDVVGSKSCPLEELVMLWRTGADGESVTLPLQADGDYDFKVTWHDESAQEEQITSNSCSHAFAMAGDYEVTIRGKLHGFAFKNEGDKLKLIKILQWGTHFRFGNSGGYFWGCSNLVSLPSGAPDLTGTISMLNMFNDGHNLGECDLSKWDVSRVTNFNNAFMSCYNFNSDLSGWNVSAATAMTSMFGHNGKFRSDVRGWNVSSVTTMAYMFYNNALFTYDLSGWNTASVASGQCSPFCQFCVAPPGCSRQ